MKVNEILIKEKELKNRAEQLTENLLTWFITAQHSILYDLQLANSVDKALEDEDFGQMYMDKKYIGFKVPNGVITDESFHLILEVVDDLDSGSVAGFVPNHNGLENTIFLFNFIVEPEDEIENVNDIIETLQIELEERSHQYKPYIVHEMTHYLDKEEEWFEVPSQEQSKEEYFNSVQEIRAYVVQAIHDFENDLDNNKVSLDKFKDFEDFYEMFVRRYLHSMFYGSITEETENYIREELYKVYQEYF